MVFDVDRSEFISSYTTGKFETTFRSGERAWERKRIHGSCPLYLGEVCLKPQKGLHLGDIESVLYSGVLYSEVV